MSADDFETEQEVYRLVLLLPETGQVLAERHQGMYRLPSLAIPKWTRVAEELQKAVRLEWNVCVFFLDVLPGLPGSSPCAVGEVLSDARSDALKHLELHQFNEDELCPQLRACIGDLLCGRCGDRGPFYRMGWIHDATAWLYRETGKSLSSAGDIRQYNAGGSFPLVSFSTEDGTRYWLKAAPGPGENEFAITQRLAKLYPDALPPLLAVRDDWSAWLMGDAGTSLEAEPALQVLEQAARIMAEMQRHTAHHIGQLVDIGALDRSPLVLWDRCAEIFSYVNDAMAMQTSTKTLPLTGQRIQEMKSMVEAACQRVSELGIPNAVVHGDLNRGNVLFDGSHCRFADWRETYIGNPLVALEHITLMSPMETRAKTQARLKAIYREVWEPQIPRGRMNVALALMPLVAATSAIYGRGDWLLSDNRHDPGRLRYVRAVARHIDRALQLSEVRDALSWRSDAPIMRAAAEGNGCVTPATLRKSDSETRAMECSTQLDSCKPQLKEDATLEAVLLGPSNSSSRWVASFLSVCAYTMRVCEAWILLLFIEVYLRTGGAKTVYKVVARQRLIPTKTDMRMGSEGWCHALDLACVFYLKRVRCLQHSAALTLLLRRHGWRAEMVIGGRMFPSGFHAWVQIGNVVVNDKEHVLRLYQVLERC
jgi:aminoglycoside phosphotransferase (APT) family kinase protein